MLSATNIPVTNYSAMIAMLTGNGGLLAWLLPTHCLHSLEKGLPLQRAFRQCVEHVQAMDTRCQEHPDHYGYSNCGSACNTAPKIRYIVMGPGTVP